jgi:hypothetical protein
MIFFAFINLTWSICRKIKKYIRGDGGYLIMSNGASLNVSKQRKEDFLNIYSGS